MDKNSMLYWWPRVKGLEIPMPKTEIVEFEMSHSEVFGILDGEKRSADAWDRYTPKIQDAIRKVGTPAFLRTDHTSAKFDWESTCYYDASGHIRHHISSLVEFSAMADMIGLNVGAIAVREYISMASAFTAFSGQMPVNPERRYFVKNGEVICHHPYWIAEAIDQGTLEKDLPENWLELLEAMNTETSEEIEFLTGYAETIAGAVDGYWSVDFCKSRDGRWVFIDMAEGVRSWHPDCGEVRK